MHIDLEPNIVHQGRGSYIEVGMYRFEIEAKTPGSIFCIYFPSEISIDQLQWLKRLSKDSSAPILICGS